MGLRHERSARAGSAGRFGVVLGALILTDGFLLAVILRDRFLLDKILRDWFLEIVILQYRFFSALILCYRTRPREIPLAGFADPPIHVAGLGGAPIRLTRPAHAPIPPYTDYMISRYLSLHWSQRRRYTFPGIAALILFTISKRNRGREANRHRACCLLQVRARWVRTVVFGYSKKAAV